MFNKKGVDVVVATNSKMSRVFWISGGVIVIAILIFTFTFFSGIKEDVKVNVAPNANSTTPVAILGLENVSWCPSLTNAMKEDFPSVGENSTVRFYGAEKINEQMLCKVLVIDSKKQYYFSEDMVLIYYQNGQNKKNLTLLNPVL